jgi:hypothetical protein
MNAYSVALRCLLPADITTDLPLGIMGYTQGQGGPDQHDQQVTWHMEVVGHSHQM